MIHRWGWLIAGFFCILQVAGCDKPAATSSAAPRATAKSEKEDHIHGAGPHGGAVFDWGPYHAEFCVEHPKQEATIYILKTDMKTHQPIKVEKLHLKIKDPVFELDLMAAPEKNDAPGTASCFIGKHERFGKEQEFGGTLSGEVEGKKFSGDFQELPEEPAPKK
ncbi:hypothetical protein KIH39_01020 [Telmatocola sphagniphila]|uniref:Uncharacterized protein n=1 Tax=Telmatocola sphagniphila TaxID=1123043 RepID=A0A8E6EVC3_9BACT|nr:hypothetical protein [Telmatocola sphagniphila]QVL32530.1 hypothetical protein KIH39_01020 [Telmatocola sphagniphila]